MSIKVDVSINVWTCECQQRFFGDAVADAFRNWWTHVGLDHQEEFE